MKIKFLFAAVTVLAFISCQKNKSAESTLDDRKRFPVTVSLKGIETKANTADTPEESKVNNIQILVFRPDGDLDAFKKSSTLPVTGVSCTAGPKTIYAVVNSSSDFGTIKNLSELTAKTFSFDKEKLNGFQMLGKTSSTISSASTEVSVSVDRAVAKIHFGNIKTEFQTQGYQSASFQITKIYAINVVEQYALTYPKTSVPPTINKAKLGTGLGADQQALLLYTPASPITITNAASPTPINKNFYVYPNYSDNAGDKTRIVVEARLDGKTYYYPLTFNNHIKANTYYDITGLVIKRPGSEDPNTPIVVQDGSFTIVVSDWTTGETMTTTI